MPELNNRINYLLGEINALNRVIKSALAVNAEYIAEVIQLQEEKEKQLNVAEKSMLSFSDFLKEIEKGK